MCMNVFIDTNILLSFFHFTSDDLDSLDKVFTSHKKGDATLHLTDQVRDEFQRNREIKITDALAKFKEVASSLQAPTFIRTLEGFEALENASTELRKQHKEILKKAEEAIIKKELSADHVITNFLKKANIHETTLETYSEARQRVDIGNPPGKNGSLGDAINWLLLMKHVPDKQDLYIISDDKDFYSHINKESINPFLKDEWERKKNSKVKCYKSLTPFLSDHFAGVTLAFDPKKKDLIDALSSSPNFITTHSLVSKLDEFKYFSLLEAKALLEAAETNNQFGWIVSDEDVKALILRAICPHRSHIKEPGLKAIIAEAES